MLADTTALDTLSERDFRAGYAEVVKYGLIGDRRFFEFLESNWREIFAGGPARAEAIAISCAAKARIVAADETEQGERALLNLGHTFGHAFESLTHYDSPRLVHGEGVAIGMASAFRFSRDLGLCSGQDATRVEAHLKALGLPTRMRDIPGFEASADDILAAMRQDKKVERGRLTFILVRGIGESPSSPAISTKRASRRSWPASWPLRSESRAEPALLAPGPVLKSVHVVWPRYRHHRLEHSRRGVFRRRRDRPDRSFSGADACA